MSKKNYHIKNNQIILDKMPKSFKKMTATRFAAALGLNRWNTPFKVWCALTRTWEPPFEDSIYTIAGKTIEPKIIKYLQTTYFMDIKTPTDVYGEDYFKKTWGDFYPNKKIFGGMWDVLGDNYIVEIKTTKRAEDWIKEVPAYYKLQAALYAYLSGFDKFIMTASFLEDPDYDDPDAFVPNAENTRLYEFSLSEEYPNFKKDYIDPAINFWNDFVATGISPVFDEKQDDEALRALRTADIDVSNSDLNDLLKRYDENQLEINKVMLKLEPKIKEQADVKSKIKEYLQNNLSDDEKYAELSTGHFNLKMTKSVRKSIDSKKLKADDLYEKYLKESEAYTLREIENN